MTADPTRRWTDWITAAHGMDDAVWARHANPWSIWTRVPVMPVGVVVLLLREELGLWTWGILAALAVWVWLNPRAFAPPERLDRWDSRAVMGEKLWVERARRPIPAETAVMAARLSILQGLSVLPLIWGIWTLDWGVALTATALVLVSKFWFLDRMALLQAQMGTEGGRG